TPMLDAKPLATRSAQGRLPLVADEKAAVFFDDADNLFEILLRGRDKTSDPLYGFGQKSSDPPLRCRRLNRFFDVLGAFQVAAWISEPERATVAIGVGNMMHAGNNIRHQPPARLGRKAQGQIGATTITMAEGDNILALGMDLREKHGRFIGFRAAVGEKRFF